MTRDERLPLRFTIPIEPKTKKNSMVPYTGKDGRVRGMGQSDIYRQYEKDCAFLIPGWARLHIDGPVNVKAVFYRKTRRRVDLVNLLSALHDVLVKYGVLVDDNANVVVSVDGSYVDYDRDHPRTEVTITAWESATKECG